MAVDRESLLKKAEKLLRQGRLQAAIAEYERVLEDQPRDWTVANTLGDLYARAGHPDRAIAQYARIAEHAMRDGFYPKAAALYKKILKINRDDEPAQLQLAEISVLQGLLADAKSLLNAVAARRRLRSDRRGEAEIVIRLGTIDPSDIDARLAAARALEAQGRPDEAAAVYKSLHVYLEDKGRRHEALDALCEYGRLRPADREVRGALARAALQAGDVARAKALLDRESAAEDPVLLFELVKAHLDAGELEAARELIPAVLTGGADQRRALLQYAWTAADTQHTAAFACVDAVVDGMVAASDFRDAATALQEFVRRVPAHVESLLKLVEVCVDGGFEAEMYAAQEQLADAYLAAGQAAEARVIAEDLVAREPWEDAHIERFRRALMMLRVPDPDAEIAQRLSGESPFMATDRFGASLPEPDAPLAEDTVLTGECDVAGEMAPSEGDLATTPPAPGSGPQNAPPEEIDLTDALGTFDTGKRDAGRPSGERDADELESVFRTLREGAEAAGDYSAQHMTLARTYLEMGKPAEAMTSLKEAARSPRLRFEAASLLGRLLMRHGEQAEALEWLERAAEAPAPSPDEGRALMYDFGVALDDAGETARALAVFLELQAEAGDYRDTPSRIDRLARTQTGG